MGRNGGRVCRHNLGVCMNMNRRVGAASSGTSTDDFVRGDFDWTEFLVCPDCGVHLQVASEMLNCSQCQRQWPIINGIPHFVTDFPYWGEITRDQMEEVNRRAEMGDWKAALLNHPEPSVQRAAQMILNVERSNWHWL